MSTIYSTSHIPLSPYPHPPPSSYNIIHSILYLLSFIILLWYLRWWYRTIISTHSELTNPLTTYLQKSSAIQHLATPNHTPEGFIDIALESDRIGPPNTGPFRDWTDKPQTNYPKHCYGNSSRPKLEQRISHLARLNENDISIDDQESGSSNGLDASTYVLPPMTTSNHCPRRPYPKNRLGRNREQELRVISKMLRDRKLLSEANYRAKYSWYSTTSRALTLPPGFGKLTPRLTEDGSSYEYAYTGDIRDHQTRTPMDILADYPRHEWACNKLYQRCTAPAHLIGNAPEYYKRIKAKEDRDNALEQLQHSIQAQLPPQQLPPLYPN